MKKLKKLKLFGTGNFEQRSYFKIEKAQSFLGCFRNMLKNLGFSNTGYYFTESNIKGEKEIKINKLTDSYQHFKNKNYDIDLVFGKNKIILLIRTEKKNRLKAAKEIMKWCKWVKINKKINKK